MDAHRVSPASDPDFYPTPPWGARAGAELLLALDPVARSVWEPACGAGHMVHGLKDYFPKVIASDLLAYDGNALFDFCGDEDAPVRPDWIVSNHPFGQTDTFIRRGRERARRGLALLMKISGLETIGREALMYGDPPLSVAAPFVERLPMHKGRWEPEGGTAAFYCWFIWFAAGVGFPAPVVLGRPRPVIIHIPAGTEARLTRADDAQQLGAR